MDLDELARKAGMHREVLGASWCTVPPEQLRALVNEVLEEAAREVDDGVTGIHSCFEIDERLREAAARVRSLKLK